MVRWKLLPRFPGRKLKAANHDAEAEAAAAQWLREYVEASKLADEASKMLSEHRTSSYLVPGPETQRYWHSVRRQVVIINTRLKKLEADLADIARKSVLDKQIHNWQEMLSELRKGEKQMALILGIDDINISDTPEDLPGTSKTSANEVKTANVWSDQSKGLAGLLDDQHIANIPTSNSNSNSKPHIVNIPTSNSKPHIANNIPTSTEHVASMISASKEHIVGIQKEIIRQQDVVLDGLGETVLNTRSHILALHQKLNLHTGLLVGDIWDLQDEHRDSHLQRSQNRVPILNRRNKAGCSCICLLLWVLAIVILAVLVWKLWKHWKVIKLFLIY